MALHSMFGAGRRHAANLDEVSANDASDAMTNGSRAAIDAKLSRDVRALPYLQRSRQRPRAAPRVSCTATTCAAYRIAIAYRDLD